MALSFPRDMPSGGVEDQSFQIARVDYGYGRVDGSQGAVTAGFPLWRMALTLNNADADETDEWRAWVPGQRGAQRPFYGRDLTRPYPKAHAGGFDGMNRASGGAFDGAATGWSVNADRDVVTLSGLPAALTLSLNDYIGFRWTTLGEPRRALVQCMEGVVASGAGVLAVTVEPALPTLVPGGAVAYLDRPGCIMKLVPGETRMGPIDLVHSAGGTIVAVQHLLP